LLCNFATIYIILLT